jgi:hypothetical protein
MEYLIHLTIDEINVVINIATSIDISIILTVYVELVRDHNA